MGGWPFRLGLSSRLHRMPGNVRIHASNCVKKTMYRRGGQIGKFRLVAELAIYSIWLSTCRYSSPRNQPGVVNIGIADVWEDSTVSRCMHGRWLSVACTGKALAVHSVWFVIWVCQICKV